MSAQQDETPIRQKYLGNKGLIVFLALLSAFVPLSTDLYLPALPGMARYFDAPAYQTNLTLILFFIFYSLATLVWGPFSDKYGRRPILLAGLTVYAIASGLCAVASSIYLLMVFRVLQALGAGAASAVGMAIVKDVYRGRKRESTLALVQSLTVISPIVAPMLGAVLLRITSWRGTFVAQTILGIVVVAASVAFRETLEERSSGSVAHTLGRLVVVIKNPAFASLLLVFSATNIPSMAFITASSYIYQDHFGLTSQAYSYYFALNSIAFVIGPLLYIKLSARFDRRPIITVCLAITVLGGLLVLLLGRLEPWVFALTLLPATIPKSCSTPPGTYLMLDQQKADTGSASALMGSAFTVMGSIGMIFISFDWGDLVQALGALYMVFGVLCLAGWLVVKRRPFLAKVGNADGAT